MDPLPNPPRSDAGHRASRVPDDGRRLPSGGANPPLGERVPASGGAPFSAASNRPLTLLAHGVLLTAAAAAVFLAAGPAQGSLGIFLAAAGLVMIVCPPRVRVDWRLWLAAAGIVASGSLALLPEHWFHVPAWRTTLEAIPSMPLPASVTPVPWETAFWLAVLVLSALIGLFGLAHPLRSAGLLGLGIVAVLVTGAYTALAIYAKKTGWHYPYGADASFGFFPNRNHTATLLVVGSILAMGVLRFTLRERRWPLALIAGGGLAINAVALCFFSGSRGGIVFLLAGTVIWLGGLGRAHRSVPLLVSFAALLVAGGLLFLASGSEVRHRLLPSAADRQNDAPAPTPANSSGPTTTFEPPVDAPLDLRVLIYQDTMGLVRDLPVTGTGLGAFAMVFPQYRQKSLFEYGVIHPESDWLMLVTEAGIPAGIFAGWLFWLLLRRVRLWRQTPSWPLRWGFVAAVATAALHGIVDVPAHRIALGWWVLVLAGISLHGGWSEKSRPSRLQHALFVVGGLGAMTLGTQLIRAEWFGAPPLPPFAAAIAQAEVFKVYQRQDFAAAREMARLAIQKSPMFEPLYTEYGPLLAETEVNDADSDEIYKTQRLLNPITPYISLKQGETWMNYDPVRTTAFWRDALARRARLDRAGGFGTAPTIEYYRGMLRRAAGKEVLETSLFDLAGNDPDLVLAWLETVSPAPVARQLDIISANGPLLQKFGEPERERFLNVWYAKGDREAMQRWLSGRDDWRTAAWPVLLRLLVDKKQYEQAVREAAVHFGISLALPDAHSEQIGVSAGLNANDPAAEFLADWRSGNVVSARRILAEAGGNPQALPSPEILRLKSAVEAQEGNWPAAWQSLAVYLDRTGQLPEPKR